VLAPDPDKLNEFPSHIAVSLPALTDGSRLTLTVTESILLQPLIFVAVTKYVVVPAGYTSGLFIVTLDISVKGLHAYVILVSGRGLLIVRLHDSIEPMFVPVASS
jgi:hypothetical protein